MPDLFVVIDIETTGLSPDYAEIIEIGAIKIRKGATEHPTFQPLIKPEKKIPKKATEINGITQQMVDADGIELKNAIEQFLQFIGDHRMVAYNASFDMGFLRSAAARFGYEINNKHSCALKMARRAWPEMESHKLESVAKAAGWDSSGNHRALKDCILAAKVYQLATHVLGEAQ